jgi:hypothetical protein
MEISNYPKAGGSHLGSSHSLFQKSTRSVHAAYGLLAANVSDVQQIMLSSDFSAAQPEWTRAVSRGAKLSTCNLERHTSSNVSSRCFSTLGHGTVWLRH